MSDEKSKKEHDVEARAYSNNSYSIDTLLTFSGDPKSGYVEGEQEIRTH